MLGQWSRSQALRRTATAHALRTAVALETFSIACWQIHFSSGQHYDQTGQPFAEALPVLILPEGDWQDLDVRLADKALSFANSLAVSG